MRRQHTTRATRTWLLLACAIVLVVVALVWIGRAQRDATSDTVLQQRAGDELFDAAFDMETGVGGFVLTRQPTFLTIAQDAHVEFDEQLAEARHVSADTTGAGETLDVQVDAIRGGGCSPTSRRPRSSPPAVPTARGTTHRHATW